MAEKKKINVSFRKVQNGFVVTQNIDNFDSKGQWKSSETKEFVSTTASGTKKIISDLTDDLKDEVKGNGTGADG